MTAKTDVFIRVFSSSQLRLGFAIATVARWQMQEDCRVSILQWKGGIQHYWPDTRVYLLPNSPTPFATLSLQVAEKYAISDPYIICNDDNLPYGKDFVSKGIAIMDVYQEYACISGVVDNGHEEFKKDKEVTETHAVGGLVFLRKNIVTDFPPLEDRFWDGERHKQVIEKGFKSGYARDLPYLHMGARFSIASPEHFVGA